MFVAVLMAAPSVRCICELGTMQNKAPRTELRNYDYDGDKLLIYDTHFRGLFWLGYWNSHAFHHSVHKKIASKVL
jgi:hypothetical protein